MLHGGNDQAQRWSAHATDGSISMSRLSADNGSRHMQPSSGCRQSTVDRMRMGSVVHHCQWHGRHRHGSTAALPVPVCWPDARRRCGRRRGAAEEEFEEAADSYFARRASLERLVRRRSARLRLKAPSSADIFTSSAGSSVARAIFCMTLSILPCTRNGIPIDALHLRGKVSPCLRGSRLWWTCLWC